MSYATQFKRDFKIGTLKETELLPLFRKTFDETFQRTPPFSVIDYEGETCYGELKTRNIKSTDYKDIMIGKNKIDFALTCDKPVIFCYNLINGVYYYQFSEKDICNEGITFREGGRQDRCKDERKECAFIKTSLLIKLR